MIVKFFSKPSGGGGGGSSIDYLLDEEKHQVEEIEGEGIEGEEKTGIRVLQGDPELSREITEGLEFATNYTVGCLSFEEGADHLTDEQKREIMQKFEEVIFSGLEQEQYNILWVEHTDKGSLELNFFIPNVELSSGKRLQPYYDKADRPIVENFKQVINHDYGLSDPNDPEKQKALISNERLPKDKKQALEAINNGIGNLVGSGQIKSRGDVLEALESAGFEVARVTPKNISVKTEGQNLRLKGAFYEETFRGGESIRDAIEERSQQYNRDSEQRYQTARERLASVVSKRKHEFEKRYPNRTEKNDKNYTESFQFREPVSVDGVGIGGGGANVLGENGIQQTQTVESFSGQLPTNQQINHSQEVQSGQSEPILRSDRPDLQGADVGKQGRTTNDNNDSGGLKTNDRDRENVAESVKRLVEKVRNRLDDFGARIKEISGRKQLDNADVQRNNTAKRTNQQSINSLEQHTKQIENQVEKQAKKSRSWGWGR